jgi:carbon monoxide dehydrogenase subunit G
VELTNEFKVGVPVEQAWAVLTDVERIAPCMPGAELREVEGDEYRGVVKVKVGPITAEYRGKARFLEQDPEAHRAVLRAEGRETRGQGNANATITATLEAEGDGTKASVVTDLAITGRVAQFGRGVLADVSSKLLTQFVQCLETTVLGSDRAAGGEAAPAEAATGGAGGTPRPDGAAPTGAPGGAQEPSSIGGGAMAASPSAAPSAIGGGAPAAGVRTIEPRRAEPVDLVGVAGGSILRRLGPIAGGAGAVVSLLAVLVIWRRWRR